MKKYLFFIVFILFISSCDYVTGILDDESNNSVVNISTISGVSIPVGGEVPVKLISETNQFNGTVIWLPGDSLFKGEMIYTAVITLTAKSGYTFSGVDADFFIIPGASSVTNSSDSGVITAVFPETSHSTGEYSTESEDCQDAAILAYDTANNSADSYRLRIGNHNSASWELRSLIQFDISDLPDTVTSAKLRIYFLGNSKAYDDNEYPDNNVATKVALYEVSEVWNENSVTWSSKPVVASNHFAIVDTLIPNTTDGTYFEVDILNLYNQWKSGARNNCGFEIRGHETWQDDSYQTEFVSSDNADFPDYFSRIIVETGN